MFSYKQTKNQEKSYSNFRMFILRSSLVVFGLVMTFVILEGATRVCSYFFFHRLFTIDKNLGWRHIPNAGRIWKTPEFSHLRKYNSKGIRDREYSYKKPDGIFRIIVLGDSYTEGEGVERENIYIEVLEKMLEGHNIEVINMGVSAYNTVQELIYLEEEGMKYEPDLVILATTWNDIDDNVVPYHGTIGARPEATLKNNELTIIKSVEVTQTLRKYSIPIPFFRLFYHHSYLYFFLNSKIYHKMFRVKILKFYQQELDSRDLAYKRNLYGKLVEKIHGIIESHSGEFMIFYINSNSEIVNDKNNQNVYLTECCKSNHIPFCDLFIECKKVMSKGTKLYYDEGHWNKIAHSLAAKKLYRFLIKKDLIVLQNNTASKNKD